MKNVTPPDEMDRNRATRPYEVTTDPGGANEHRHYWDYAEALADFDAGKDAGRVVLLHRLVAGGEDKRLGVWYAQASGRTTQPPAKDDGGPLFVKTVVACTDAMGSPSFTFYVVRCSQDQYEEGDHYAAAEQEAEEDGYEGPMVTYDENDGPNWLFERFGWDGIDATVDIVAEPAT